MIYNAFLHITVELGNVRGRKDAMALIKDLMSDIRYMQFWWTAKVKKVSLDGLYKKGKERFRPIKSTD